MTKLLTREVLAEMQQKKAKAREALDELQEEQSRVGSLRLRMQQQVMEALEEGNTRLNKIEWQEDDYSVMVWITLQNGRKVVCRIPGETLRARLMKRPDERRDEWDIYVHGGI